MLTLGDTPALRRRRPPSAGLFGAVLLCAPALASCGGATQADADGTGSSVEICDRSVGVRLVALSGGGGPVPPGVDMLSENGWHYLLVSGQCEAWVLKDYATPLRHLMLSPEQAKSLARDLRLGEWSSFPPAMRGCPDGSTVIFRFAKDRVHGIPCGLDPDHPVRGMSTALFAQIGNLYAAGAAFEGDVRFILGVDEPSAPRPTDHYRDAPLWPLSTSPESIALSTNDLQSYRRGTSRHASGDEATLLRALRTSWLEGTIGSKLSEFIPIVGADGARFHLYLRDSCPWENASGILDDDLTSR